MRAAVMPIRRWPSTASRRFQQDRRTEHDAGTTGTGDRRLTEVRHRAHALGLRVVGLPRAPAVALPRSHCWVCGDLRGRGSLGATGGLRWRSAPHGLRVARGPGRGRAPRAPEGAGERPPLPPGGGRARRVVRRVLVGARAVPLRADPKVHGVALWRGSRQHRRFALRAARRVGLPPLEVVPDPAGSWGPTARVDREESCRTPLMGGLKESPSVDMGAACPLPARRRPRPNGVPTEVDRLPSPVLSPAWRGPGGPVPLQPASKTFDDGRGFPAHLRPGVATPRVLFRPCRFSRLRRLAPRMPCRSVAPCCRPWGSPGCRPLAGSRRLDVHARARLGPGAARTARPEGRRCQRCPCLFLRTRRTGAAGSGRVDPEVSAHPHERASRPSASCRHAAVPGVATRDSGVSARGSSTGVNQVALPVRARSRIGPA